MLTNAREVFPTTVITINCNKLDDQAGLRHWTCWVFDPVCKVVQSYFQDFTTRMKDPCQRTIFSVAEPVLPKSMTNRRNSNRDVSSMFEEENPVPAEGRPNLHPLNYTKQA